MSRVEAAGAQREDQAEGGQVEGQEEATGLSEPGSGNSAELSHRLKLKSHVIKMNFICLLLDGSKVSFLVLKSNFKL